MDNDASVYFSLQESDLGFSVFHTDSEPSSSFSTPNESPTSPLHNSFADVAVHVQHLARQMDRHRLQVFHPTPAMSREINANSTSIAAAYLSLSPQSAKVVDAWRHLMGYPGDLSLMVSDANQSITSKERLSPTQCSYRSPAPATW
jgi:hypothetical protein